MGVEGGHAGDGGRGGDEGGAEDADGGGGEGYFDGVVDVLWVVSWGGRWGEVGGEGWLTGDDHPAFWSGEVGCSVPVGRCFGGDGFDADACAVLLLAEIGDDLLADCASSAGAESLRPHAR